MFVAYTPEKQDACTLHPVNQTNLSTLNSHSFSIFDYLQNNLFTFTKKKHFCS